MHQANDSGAPFKVSERKPIQAPAYVWWSLAGVIVAATAAWVHVTVATAEIPGIKSRLDAHDAALAQIPIIANDITWIRRSLEANDRDIHRTISPSRGNPVNITQP